ncbi:MAG: hypothetical protein HQK75_02445 [Candidatus Magnetomorum sp.]|nr:hypothetical protein [Candidatus Magnetomorum sp.]
MKSDHPLNETSLDILVVNIQSVPLGLNMAQIQNIQKIQSKNEVSAKTIYLHKALRLPQKEISYKSPHIFWAKTVDPSCGLIIDEPQKMINSPVEQILPLPYLVEKNCVYGAIWGAVIDGSNFLLLLDVIRLIKGYRS